MNQYLKVIYGSREINDYPKIFAKHIKDKYLKTENRRFKRLLDLGAGDGTFSKAFKEVDSELVTSRLDCDGCDGINKTCDFESGEFPYPENFFDFIFCKSVIEHIKNTDHFLSEIYRVLAPKGTLVMLTPSWEYNYRHFFDDYTHIKPFNRKGLQDSLEINNFKKVDVEYFYHLSLTWKNKYAKILCMLTRLLPDKWKWKDKQERKHNVWIRFSKEVQLLGVATK